MKPIKLDIEGLNSFETKQVIDFDKVGQGVFGIFGKTGSGKSTILDAITLALYGEVERSKQNIDFINSKRKKTAVSLTFEIFVLGKKHLYEVNRNFVIKKNGKDVESSAILFELKENEKMVLTEGTLKVNEKILEIVGLGKNEFVKCIALPQGEFSAFLSARESERTEILSNIFSLSKYGEQLSKKVKSKVNEFELDVNSLTASLSMVDYATDEELENARQKYEDFNQSYNQEKTNLNEKTTLYSKLSVSLEKKKKLDEINFLLKNLEKQKYEIEKLENEINKNQSANAIKNDYEKLIKNESDEKELNQKLNELEEKLKSIEKEYDEESANFRSFKSKYDIKIDNLNSKLTKVNSLTELEKEKEKLEQDETNIKSNIESQEEKLKFEQEKLSYVVLNIENIEKEIESIDDFIEANKSDVDLSYALEQTKGIESEIILIDEFVKNIEKIYDYSNEELLIAKEDYDSSIKQEKKISEKINQIQDSINVAFEDIDKTNFNKIRSCDKQLDSMKESYTKVTMFENIISKLIYDKESRLANIASIGEKIANSAKILEKLEQKIQEKEIFIQNERERREELVGGNFFALISNQMKIGDDCPICGSRVIQKSYEETFDLNPINAELACEEQKLKELQSNKEKIISEIATLKAISKFERTQIEANEKEIEKIQTEQKSILGEYVEINDHTNDNFIKLYSLLQETSENLEKLIDLQDMLREEYLNLIIRKTESGTKIAIYSEYLEKLSDILYKLNTKKAEREIAILNVNEKYTNLKEYKKQVAEGKNIELIIEEKKEKKYSLKEGQTKILIEKAKLEANIAEINSSIAVLSEKLTNLTDRKQTILAQITESGVPEGLTISEEEKNILEEIDNLKNEFRKHDLQVDSSRDLMIRTQNDLNISRTILDSKRGQIKDLKDKISLAIKENNFSDNNELEKYFTESGNIKEKQAKVSDYKSKHQLFVEQKLELESYSYEDVNEEKVHQLKLDLDFLTDSVQELSKQVGRTSVEFEKLESDNKKRNNLLKKLEIASKKYETAKELFSVLKGKALAEYVAEEFLEEITEIANQKLNILLDGKYNLKFINKDFVVEDNFNDGELRSASTLSGGETFLVSLSLALGISESISLLSSRTIDFFFLDEGFGTLDSELCETVVSALHKLESQNLNIGLISHVGELEESIKNKILVTKTPNGSKVEITHSL